MNRPRGGVGLELELRRGYWENAALSAPAKNALRQLTDPTGFRDVENVIKHTLWSTMKNRINL